MSWRPEGWKNPYKEQPNNLSMTTLDALHLRVKECVFEAGADAMLAALKEKGQYPIEFIVWLDGSWKLRGAFDPKGIIGTLAFIPEEAQL